MNEKQSGILKLCAGALIALLGVFGVVKSQSLKRRAFRLTGTILGAIVTLSGVYLFALGLDDLALAKIGTSKIGSAAETQPLFYNSPLEFKQKLESTFAANAKHFSQVRRLKFVCGDKSKSFRVFNTALGVFGVPDHDVQCADGSFLVHYYSLGAR